MEELTLEQQIQDSRIVRAVSEMGFETLTPIQQQAIPVMMSGVDLIGQAQTGTGKTAAFGIPILRMVDPAVSALQALVLCPTRELAIQAADEIRKFAKYMDSIRVLPIYGGQDISKQIRSLRGNIQIVVGTPGRVMDHMRRHTIKLSQLKTVVLDEADEMLNMGFREDMETILSQIEQEHQTVLFSATMPQAILDITGQFQKSPVILKTIQKELTVPLIKQYYYEVGREHKKEAVSRLLDYYNPKRCLIFCNTKKMVEELTEELKGRGYFAEGLHGDLSQNMRDRVMTSFRSGAADILIATDVAARGIDVDDVEAVINFDVPQDIEYYVHRIGRTGRAGRTGRSFTLVCGREIFKIREIENACKTKMRGRMIPSGTDISQAKANKVLSQIMEIIREKDLSDASRIIEDKMEAEDCTAFQLAAAFLQMHIGDKLEDIPMESYQPRRRGRFGPNEDNTNRNRRRRRDNEAYGSEKKKRDSSCEKLKGKRYDKKNTSAERSVLIQDVEKDYRHLLKKNRKKSESGKRKRNNH